MKPSFLMLIIFLSFTSCFSAKGVPLKPTNASTKTSTKAIVNHSDWEALLKKYVAHNGDVNYKGFKTDIDKLNAYVDYLATQIPQDHWSKDELLAYYINVYNANTIKLILENYPTKSIKDIKNPWLKNRVKIGDKNFSLADIENGILRKMDEPRIHFAINCASFSCPKLLNTAYTANNVESLLQKAAIDFINNPNKNKISENKVQLSEIFKWYKKDFTKNGSIIAFINKYSKTKISSKANINYINYNWSLNEQKN